MGGANIELAAISVNDNEIVGNPQITFFKSVFKRHTNFSIESREIINSSSSTLDFNTVDTEFTVKRLVKDEDTIILRPENSIYDDIIVQKDQHLMIWGVVVHVIHHLK